MINQMSQSKVDISIIFPTLNEGANVAKVLDEIIEVMSQIGKSYEVIMIDAPSKNPSFPTLKEYAQKHENFYALQLTHVRPAGSDKSAKYMVGFNVARGDIVVQIDSDGQDNPADLPKFLQKIDEGYDMVTGHKQKRKDGKVYMLTSKISNTLTRWLTGVQIHDMNCGFKVYRSYVAKELNLKGRWYRFIPAILVAKGYKITEVPIENRKRTWGKTNFSFINRMQGGVFDMVTVVLITKMGETPIYFYGWLSAIFVLITISSVLSAVVLKIYSATEIFWLLTLMLIACAFGILAVLSYLIGITNEYQRKGTIEPIESYGIKEVYPEIPH